MSLLAWRGCAVAVALVALAAASVPTVVSAQANPNAEAGVLFERGNRYLERAMRARGSRREVLLQQALDTYVETMGLVRSRNVIFNTGFVSSELGRHGDAFGYYNEYMGMAGLSDEERAEGQRRLDALRPQIAILAIESEPSGAEVRVDRQDLAPRGRTPLEVAVPAGQHRIFLAVDGYRPGELTATAALGERVAVRGTLAPEPVPVVIRAPAGGRLTIDGRPVQPGQEIEVLPGRHTIRFEPATERVIEIRPGESRRLIDLEVVGTAPRGRGALAFVANTAVRVSVDGVVVGEGDDVGAEVASGRHVIEVSAPGHVTTRSEIDVQPDESLSLRVHMERSVGGGSTLGDAPLFAWVATGAVGAAAIALSINAIATHNEYKRAAENGEPRETRVDLLDDTESANTIADIFWAGTAVVGLTAILLTILDRPTEQPPSLIQIGAGPLPGGGMVTAALPWGIQ